MSLNKIAKFKAKNEPYLKPISDLGIGFYNLDENTATLQFQIYNDYGPLLISDENVDVHGYFESTNKSVSSVLDLHVTDGMNGIVQITLDREFLQASTSTKVTGQLYIGLKNIDNKPEYNQTAVFGEFNFEVADALINKVSAFTKVEYIRMFDKLRDEIKTRTKEMEDDIGNIKTLVNEVKDAVTDGKADITKIKNDSISELENIANTTNTSVQQQASQAISDIQSIVDEYTTKLNDETEDKINQVNEESDKVLESIKQNNVVTTEETENWQKSKLTGDNGSLEDVPYVDLDNPELSLSKTCFVYVSAVINQPTPAPANGYLFFYRRSADYMKMEYRPYNSDSVFHRTKFNGSWLDWTEISNTQADTGWLPITIKNGYNKSTIPDFEPSYRVIDYGTYKKLYVRLGVTNLTNGKNTVASIPTELNPYKIYSLGVSTIAKIPPKVIVSGGNIEVYPNSSDSYISTDYVIYQDEWII